MKIDLLKRYFNLDCENLSDVDKINFQRKFNTKLPKEYDFILSHVCAAHKFEFIFFIDCNFLGMSRFHFRFNSFMTLQEVEQIKDIMTQNEFEWHEWNDYISFGIDGFFPISEIDLDSDLKWLFISTNSEDNGALYIIDVNLIYEVVDGYPIKVKVAESISDLIELSESQKDKIPKEYFEV